MTRCEECGATNAQNAAFCVRCGADLAGDQRSAAGQNTDSFVPVTEATLAFDAATMIEPDQAEAADAADPAGDAESAASPEIAAAEALLVDASDRLSRGDADGAAVKCREAIELVRDLIAAHSLLGMAEEARGNTVAAAGAYRRVLQLDPDRLTEREKLEMLAAEGTDSVDEDSLDHKIVTWAPWVAAVGAAFVVLAVLTFIGVRVATGGAVERTYTEQMQIAQAALDDKDYATARSAFSSALSVKPDDPDAERGLGYAQRKLAGLGGTAPAPDLFAQPMPYQAQIVPSSGPNVFTPIPIGAGQLPGTEPATGQPPLAQAQMGTRTSPPPLMASQERVEVSRPTTTTPGTTVPFGNVLDDPGDQPPAPAPAPEPAGDDTQVADQPRGECTIWLSPRGSSAQSSGGSSQPAPTTSHAQTADQLRRQASGAISSGDGARGRQLIDQAIQEYRADSEANPARRSANQASINSLEAQRQQVGE